MLSLAFLIFKETKPGVKKGEALADDTKRMRGKGSSFKRFLRKNSNIVDGRREAVKLRLEKERLEKQRLDAGLSGLCLLQLLQFEKMLLFDPHPSSPENGSRSIQALWVAPLPH